MEREDNSAESSYGITKKTILFGVVPFVVLGVMVVILVYSPGMIFQSSIKPLPEISIEKVEFLDNSIVVL